jgi:hypothetical protein
MNAVSSDYGATPPANLTLNIGLTRRANALYGSTDVGVSGRTADVTIEGTVFGAAVCDGTPSPAGGYDIDSGIPGVLVR